MWKNGFYISKESDDDVFTGWIRGSYILRTKPLGWEGRDLDLEQGFTI